MCSLRQQLERGSSYPYANKNYRLVIATYRRTRMFKDRDLCVGRRQLCEPSEPRISREFRLRCTSTVCVIVCVSRVSLGVSVDPLRLPRSIGNTDDRQVSFRIDAGNKDVTVPLIFSRASVDIPLFVSVEANLLFVFGQRVLACSFLARNNFKRQAFISGTRVRRRGE